MANELVRLQTMAQVKYMNHLIKLANEQAQAKANLAFDPQGRILIDVTLSDKQLEDLIDDITEKAGNKSDVRAENFTILESLLGRKVSPSTTVSLDCTSAPLKEKFEDQLKSVLVKNKDTDLLARIKIDKLNTIAKGSIIALQQEFHFHLALVARVYQQNTGQSDKVMQRIHDKSMTEVNKLVMDTYAKALIESTGDRVDVAKLNKLLDKARKEILPTAHRIMAKELLERLTNKEDQDKVRALSASQLKHTAEKLTATANDILHLDSEQELATLIAGSEQTAHNKSQGLQFAHRQLITNSLKGGVVKEQYNPRIQIRTPSIGAATSRVFFASSEAPYVSDVAHKLGQIRKDYQLDKRLEDSTLKSPNISSLSVDLTKPRAFNYNLHTAINHTADDLQGKNLQSQSAIHILKGAHEYNAQEIAQSWASKSYHPVLCYVQNISVNGFGDELGYNTTIKSLFYAVFNPEGNKLRKEATLMTELSMLNTMYDAVPVDQQRNIQDIIGLYKSFLEDSKRKPFFSDSKEGKEAIKKIGNLKEYMQQQPKDSSNDTQANAKLALRNLMANNLHFKHDNAKLIQALSVFSEQASISGCKSGNERAQAINGRVAIFDSLVNGETLGGERLELAQSLKRLAKATSPESVSHCTKQLNFAMHKAYNNKGLQGAASIVSLVDQGASAKVEAKVNFFKSVFKAIATFFSPNYGEENATIMTNLHQEKAGKMQAHKGLGEQMNKAFKAEVQIAARSGAGPEGMESPSKMLGGLAVPSASRGQPLQAMTENLQSSVPIKPQVTAAAALTPVAKKAETRANVESEVENVESEGVQVGPR